MPARDVSIYIYSLNQTYLTNHSIEIRFYAREVDPMIAEEYFHDLSYN